MWLSGRAPWVRSQHQKNKQVNKQQNGTDASRPKQKGKLHRPGSAHRWGNSLKQAADCWTEQKLHEGSPWPSSVCTTGRPALQRLTPCQVLDDLVQRIQDAALGLKCYLGFRKQLEDVTAKEEEDGLSLAGGPGFSLGSSQASGFLSILQTGAYAEASRGEQN